MSRQLSTSQPTLRLQTKQLGTAVRRTQRNQVNAMVRLAERHGPHRMSSDSG